MTVNNNSEAREILISELKTLWKVQDNTQDQQAFLLLEQLLEQMLVESDDSLSMQNIPALEICSSIDPEDFEIQKKVLARTRQKMEELLRMLEPLERAKINHKPAS